MAESVSKSSNGKDSQQDNNTMVSAMTELPSERKNNSQSIYFLIFLLFLTCLNLFANNLLNQTVRSNISYWVPYMGIDFNQSSVAGGISSWLNFPVIFLGIPGGIITDKLGTPVAMIIYSIIGAGGLTLLIALAKMRAHLGFINVAMVVYGLALNLARTPMQKMASVLFMGPYLALAMNVNHSFSHLASILSNVIAPKLMNGIGVFGTIFFLCTVGLFSVPICFTLYGLYTKKISLKSETSGKKSLIESFKELAKVDWLVWLVLAMGFFVDGVLVAFKNVEGNIMKKNFNFTMEETNFVSSFSKPALMFSPIFSALVDKFTYRGIFLALTTAVNLLVMVLFYFASDTSPSTFRIILYSIIMKIMSTLFYASFYSYFAISIPKQVRGIGFGLIFSILSIVYFALPQILGRLTSFDDKQKLLILVFMLIFGLCLTILITVLNLMRGNPMNKDRLAREAKLNMENIKAKERE